MTSRRSKTLGFILISVLAACSGREKEEQETEKPPVRARTEILQPRVVSDFVNAPGNVRARTFTALSSRAMGQILSIAVREGDRVRKGQAVAEIEHREAAAEVKRAQEAIVEAQHGLAEADEAIRGAEAAVASAQASQELAASTRKRYDVLRERRSVSPQEYEEVATRERAAEQEVRRAQQAVAAAKARRLQVLSRVDQAQSNLESAGVVLGYARVVSPIDGVVTRRTAEPGMVASPGMPLLTVEDPRTYEFEAFVEESRAAAVRSGELVQVSIGSLPATAGKKIVGRIREIVPTADPSTRTYSVKVELPAGDTHGLASGVFGTASIPAGTRDALLIPPSALVQRGQLEGVYVVAGGVSVFRLVKSGMTYPDGIEILSGLAPGAIILPEPPKGIVEGARILDNGAPGATP
jgi:multidrug efflux pump subunit AcrA (membrane-fusion protein)